MRLYIFLFLLTYIDCTYARWSQLGAVVEGEDSTNYAGSSVALSADGSRVAVGSPGFEGTGSEAGRVRVFELFKGVWTQLGGPIDSEAALDIFGHSVALNSAGDRIAVGIAAPCALSQAVQTAFAGAGPQYQLQRSKPSMLCAGAISNGGGGLNAGSVRVFQLADGAWEQVGGDMDGVAAGDGFGYSVGISAVGDRVAVGAPYNDAVGLSAGQVRVFRQVSNTWALLGSAVNGAAAGVLFGSALCLAPSGNRMVVGAPGVDNTKRGYVQVFDYSSPNWVTAGASILGVNFGDFFGSAVSITDIGTRIAVGARFHNGGNGQYSGQARVYDYVLGEWEQAGTDVYGDRVGDNCGFAVALSGDGERLAVSAPGYNAVGAESGRVQVYVYNEKQNSWDQIDGDIFGEMSLDRFGEALAMTTNGNRVAVGAPESDGGGVSSGEVRVFHRTSGEGSSSASFKFYVVIIVAIIACPLITIVFLMILALKWSERKERGKIHLTDTEDEVERDEGINDDAVIIDHADGPEQQKQP